MICLLSTQSTLGVLYFGEQPFRVKRCTQDVEQFLGLGAKLGTSIMWQGKALNLLNTEGLQFK